MTWHAVICHDLVLGSVTLQECCSVKSVCCCCVADIGQLSPAFMYVERQASRGDSDVVVQSDGENPA